MSKGKYSMAVLAVAGAVLCCGGTAQAYTADYCGLLIPSMTSSWACYSPQTNLTYNRAQYTGGGNIQELTVGLRGNVQVGFNTTFVSICYSNGAISRGTLRQYDGGANHTIYGRVDDSPNHTNCL
ncbi:hypothetical protein [Conexibacter sp. SYSU D00693]|uniref:hypothetical protein n=1 Tax=Conexibacter sp. SYSU D00693 TaxID=2812560 RepID=UPI00196B71EC|nr:hypothetical protein [Conexibacter sp. SYSU D00693]